MEMIIALLGGLALIAILILYGGLTWGFVLYRIWYWFVLPVFPQLPHIGYWQAVGLMMFIGLFHNQDVPPEYEGLKRKTQYSEFIMPWLALGITWIFHAFFI